MATVLDAADARFLAMLTKSADRGLADAAETALAAIPVRFAVADADLLKVGPKGYIHGWIYVGPHPNVGQLVHQVKKDRSGNIVSERHGHISRIADGHVHVTWDDGKKNIVQHVHDDTHRGGLVERGAHEGGADHFSAALAAGTAANRKKDHAEAARQYDLAAEHARDDKTRADMKARALAARAKVGDRAPKPPRTSAKPRSEPKPKPLKAKGPATPSKPDSKPGGGEYAGPRHKLPAGVSPADVDTLRDKIQSDPFAWQAAAHGGLMRAPDQEGEELVARVGNGAATRAAWEADAEKRLTEFVQRMRPEKDDPRAPLDPVTPAELDRAKQDAARQLQQEFAGRDIATRTTEDGLARILSDGRFKTQFETKKSKGTYAPKRRAVVEDAMFGIRADSDPAQRPVYGYVATTDLDVPDPDNELNMYGGVRVVLKPHVRSRTTATLGDSLNDGVIPSPVDDPSWESFNPRWRYGSKELDYDKMRDRLYAEAQIHGGVSTDDIARIVFDSPPSATLEAALRARGIPWKVAGQ